MNAESNANDKRPGVRRTVDITSIVLTTTGADIVIPISSDAPLRCVAPDEADAIARQLESLVRLLIKASEGRLPIGFNAHDGASTVLVW